MAPAPKEESPVDEAERDDFARSLSAFAEQRGIAVDFNARAAGRAIDLYDLYKYITSKGGYDAVSGEKLAWRKVGLDFNLNPANSAAYAFALKTIYYKNLAAYEIKHLHGKQPPPVEILEDLTAKGGDLLNRTVDNFQIPPRFTQLENGTAESENDDSRTPREDKMDLDDPSGMGGRSSRGLRQAPPQRVLFQPDLSSTRQKRATPDIHPSPQPALSAAASQAAYAHSSSNPANASFTISNYEPRPQIPLTLRPLVTPSNNYPLFQAQVKKLKEAKLAALGLAPGQSTMQPGAGFDGPNIYVRLLNCIRCPIPAEQDYALHHMVKISHERGDKYKFDSFPGLAEGLIEHLLKVSSLFYDVEWRISYSQEDDDPEILDGINGTPNILDRIRNLRRVDFPDDLESMAEAHKLNKILEAGLTLRNLAMLDENSNYLCAMAQVKDMLCIMLNLPKKPAVTELKHYMLEVTEQVSRWWRLIPSDPLYQSLLRIVKEEDDRGAIVSALRALCRISMLLEEPNLLPGVPVAVLQKLLDWIVLEDEEFTGACLDFLYQYTAVPQNVLMLLVNSNILSLPNFISQLSRLLLYRANHTTQRTITMRATAPEPATEIPGAPRELMEQFFRNEEPERSRLWLRAVFEEDPDSHITQIALWQAYQQRFLEFSSQAVLLQAADFIKNVSNVFQGANAQVITAPVQKFIIKGIRPRQTPVDSKGRVYTRCSWQMPGGKRCDEFQVKPKNMYEHILSGHLMLERGAEGQWDFDNARSDAPRDCFWANCQHFRRRGETQATTRQIGWHVKTHLPDVSTKSAFRQKHNRTPATQVIPVRLLNGDLRPESTPDVDPEKGREATYKYFNYQPTAVDEYGAPSGVPMTSVLILRNLARNVPKAIALSDRVDQELATVQAMEALFGPIRERLMFVIGKNHPLAHLAGDLVARIEKGTGERVPP